MRFLKSILLMWALLQAGVPLYGAGGYTCEAVDPTFEGVDPTFKAGNPTHRAGGRTHGTEADEAPSQRMAVIWKHSVSYTAYSNALCFSLQRGDWEVYAGPRLLLNDMYMPSAGPWGVQAGISYYPVQGERVSAFVNFDYQNTFYQPYNPRGITTRKRNSVHEFNLAYGFRFYVYEGFGVMTKLGFGRYAERFHDLGEAVARNYAGYSGLINVSFFYVF